MTLATVQAVLRDASKAAERAFSPPEALLDACAPCCASVFAHAQGHALPCLLHVRVQRDSCSVTCIGAHADDRALETLETRLDDVAQPCMQAFLSALQRPHGRARVIADTDTDDEDVEANSAPSPKRRRLAPPAASFVDSQASEDSDDNDESECSSEEDSDADDGWTFEDWAQHYLAVDFTVCCSDVVRLGHRPHAVVLPHGASHPALESATAQTAVRARRRVVASSSSEDDD